MMYRVIAAATVVLSALAAPVSRGDSIRIGGLFSLSGNSAAYGQSMRDGLLLAVDEVNKRGGVNGNKLEVIVEDSQGDPKAAVVAFNRIESTRPPLFYLSNLSSVGVALAPLADEKKVVLIGLVTSAAALTQGHAMVYRFWPQVSSDVSPVLRLLQDLKVKKLGILYSTEEYGAEEQRLLSGAFSEAGGTVVNQPFEIGSKDLGGQIKQLLGQDAVYAATLGASLAAAVDQLKAAGYKGQIIMPSAGANPDYFSMPGMQGVYLVAPIIYNPGYLFAREASDRFTGRYQRPFNHWAAAGYDFIKLIAGLLEDRPVSRGGVSDMLAAGFEYSGVFGHILLPPGSHEIAFPMYPAQILSNSLKFR